MKKTATVYSEKKKGNNKGVHSKNKASKNKASKFYKKKYKGQGKMRK
jgi:hypothetical protein